MASSENILDMDAEQLERLLFEAARQDSAPQAARERALLSVTSVALGVGVASSAAAFGAPTSLAKTSSWLVAKWLLAGLGSGILTLAVAEKAQQLATHQANSAPATVLRAPHPAQHAARSGNVAAPMINHQSDSTGAPSAAFPEVIASAAPVVPSSATATRGSVPPAPVASAESRSAVPARDGNAPSSLSRELALLEQARSALAQHASSSALQALNEYRSQFAHGSLQAEAAALRVEAVGQSGDHAEAQRLAMAFLATYPTSPLCARVRTLAATFRAASPTQ